MLVLNYKSSSFFEEPTHILSRKQLSGKHHYTVQLDSQCCLIPNFAVLHTETLQCIYYEVCYRICGFQYQLFTTRCQLRLAFMASWQKCYLPLIQKSRSLSLHFWLIKCSLQIKVLVSQGVKKIMPYLGPELNSVWTTTQVIVLPTCWHKDFCLNCL